jgi:hypothetical protein
MSSEASSSTAASHFGDWSARSRRTWYRSSAATMSGVGAGTRSPFHQPRERIASMTVSGGGRPVSRPRSVNRRAAAASRPSRTAASPCRREAASSPHPPLRLACSRRMRSRRTRAAMISSPPSSKVGARSSTACTAAAVANNGNPCSAGLRACQAVTAVSSNAVTLAPGTLPSRVVACSTSAHVAAPSSGPTALSCESHNSLACAATMSSYQEASG